MEIKYSPTFEKSLRKLSKDLKLKAKKKLELFLKNNRHPSLRYKKVNALKNENPPVWEISVDMDIRITLQNFDDHIYLRNIGGHKILP
jgi:mRNA interferase RelE/StbE